MFVSVNGSGVGLRREGGFTWVPGGAGREEVWDEPEGEEATRVMRMVVSLQ